MVSPAVKPVIAKGKFGKQAVSALMEVDENSNSNANSGGLSGKLGAKASSAESVSLPPAAITWQIYRDIVLSGMEWLIEHEEIGI